MPTIVAFQSNLEDLDKLQLDREVREVVLSLSPISRRYFNLVTLGAVRLSDVARELLAHQPEVFHFSGHGGERSELVFQDINGMPTIVNSKSISLLFEHLGGKVKLIFINACTSAKTAKLLATFVPYVIAHEGPVEDNLAITFSATFYAALSAGKTIRQSFNLAKAVLEASGIGENSKPVIYPSRGEDLSLFAEPVIMARFQLKNGMPAKKGKHYKMEMWIENLPADVISIVYNYNHATIIDEIEEIENDGTGTRSEFELYGNIQVRVTLWFRNTGIGIPIALSDALWNYYRDRRMNAGTRKAFNYILEN